MRKTLPFLLLFLVPALSHAQTSGEHTSLSGRWIMTIDYLGTPVYFTMTLDQQGEKLTGTLNGDAFVDIPSGEKLEGTVNGSSLHFTAKNPDDIQNFDATIQGGVLSGTMRSVESWDPSAPQSYRFTAKLVAQRRSGAPQRHDFVPTTFARDFSSTTKPVLIVSPGDTVHTTTADAGGADEKNVMRVLGGNPQTGPFYVETATPGDTLVVHFTRMHINRDWAVSDDEIVPRGLNSNLAIKMKDTGKTVIWHLDAEHRVATTTQPGQHLKTYSVPIHPMLGCVATAPPSTRIGLNTGDSGSWGGNMDFNEIMEGATLYLPVNVPGALLYLGDAHAAQGDGELTGNALETSMDVEFTVDIIPNKTVPSPRVESDTRIMAMGLAGSLDDAFRTATANMAQWLTEKYKLTPSELAQVLGTAAEYHVSEVADRNAGVVLEIKKDRLLPLASGTIK